MTDRSQQENVQPPKRSIGFFRQLVDQARLSWALFRDNRVPIMLKIIPVAALIYTISPIDVLPDVIPILGQLDDLGIIMTAMTMFNNLAPADVVEEHRYRISMGSHAELPKSKNEQFIDVKAKSDRQ